MVIVVEASFPRQYLTAAVTSYTALPPLPSEVAKNGPFFRTSGPTVFALTVYTISDAHLEDLLAMLRERYQSFAAIPDFRCDLQEWREFREFLGDWVK